MTSEWSSVAPRAWGFRVISAIAIISTSLGLGWPRAYAASGFAAAKLLSAPLSFEPNQGQTSSAAQFLSRGSGYALFLSHGNVLLNLERQRPSPAAEPPVTQGTAADTVRMSLVGPNSKAAAVGVARQTGVVSYFFGNDPKQWRTGIPTYGKVDYAEVYPGVDLVFYGNQRELEYDFVAAPGADPGRIAWRIDGARPSVDATGDLTLSAPNGLAIFRKPVVYQLLGGKKANVEAAFVVAGSQVGFRLGSYDRSKPLVIDPVLSYVTYLAGTGTDQIGQVTGPLSNGSSQGIAIDAAGSAYVTGATASADFPTKDPYQGGQSKGSAPSVFVTKFSPDGSSLVYSTYLGGSGWDYGYAIAVDSSGSAYVTGNTNSNDFPITTGAYQTLCSPSPATPPGTVTKASCNSSNNSAFVTKLNPTGTGLVYSTFLGGYGGSVGTGIAVDSAGRAYVAGNENAPCNLSYSFPACFPTTAGATIQTINANNVTNFCFAAVFDPAGANLLYSTLFGDLNGLKTSTTTTSGATMATAMTVDSNGHFYLIGDTKAGKLPTTPGAVQPSSAPLDYSGSYVTAFRGFIAKYNPVTAASGSSLAACTYLGGKTGNTSDYLSGIAIDSSGDIYVVGYTNSNDFPVTSGAYSTACGGGGTCDAGHLTRLNPSLTSIVWSTYLGGSRQDGGDDWYFTGPVQLDGQGNVYVTGIANTHFPLLNPVESPGSGGEAGQVVVELDPTGTNLLFSTGIGSGGLDSMQTGGLAVDSVGVIYVAGNDIGGNLITTPGAFETTDPSPVPTCCYHGFVAKISPTGPTVALSTAGQVEPFAGETIVSIYGVNMASVTAEATTLPLPTSLDGNSVTVTDSAGVARPAPLYFVSPGQINFEIPAGTAAGTATVTIQNQNGTIQSTTISIGSVSPGIFELNGSGLVAAWVLPVISGVQQALQPVYQVVSGAVLALPVSLGPATEQVYLEIYGTGFRNAKSITATVGGLSVPVLGWAATLQFVGEDQVNIGPLPASLAGTGSVNIVITADGQAANTVNVTIQ
jgi:uncharacterized protein (TIGR03437 family)